MSNVVDLAQIRAARGIVTPPPVLQKKFAQTFAVGDYVIDVNSRRRGRVVSDQGHYGLQVYFFACKAPSGVGDLPSLRLCRAPCWLERDDERSPSPRGAA